MTLRRWYLIRGTWAQTEVMGNLIVPGTIDAGTVRMDEAWANKLAANVATFQQAFAGKLTAQMIEADSFTGYEIRGAKIISPGKAGDITITDNTITSSRYDESGELSETMVIGGPDGDSISLTPAPDEPPTVVISGSGGNASFSGDVSVKDLLIGDESVAQQLSWLPRGMLGWTWGSGAALPQMTNTPYGLVAFTWPLEAYRRYKLCGEVVFEGTAGDVIEFQFRWRAHPEETADIASPVVGIRRVQIPVGGIGSAHIEAIFRETFNYDNYSAMISMRNWSAASRPVRLWADGGSDQSQSYFWLEDLGRGPVTTGIEWSDGGGKEFVEPTPAPTPKPKPLPPPPTKRTYTKTYSAAYVYSWRGSTEVGDVLHHGTYQGVRRVSQIVFPYQAQQDITGATIKKVEVRLRNLHTYAGSGMTASLVPATNYTKSSTPTGASKSNETRVPWGKGQTKFVTLSGWQASTRSVYLGHYADSSGQFYGKFSRALSDCVLRVTYEK